jgi:L,D-transpeptidase catalytic domain
LLGRTLLGRTLPGRTLLGRLTLTVALCGGVLAVGPVAAEAKPGRIGPPVSTPAAPCEHVVHGAAVDRQAQLAYLCQDGAVVKQFPITGSNIQPHPGDYRVYAKSAVALSTVGGHGLLQLRYFVAFARGVFQHARIGFHEDPIRRNGQFLEPLDQIGTAATRGQSSGCIRMLPSDAAALFAWLHYGDPVEVVT